MPARPVHPKDKSRVELGVQGVEQRILAKLRNRTFFSLDELNREIWINLDEYNNRPFQQLEGSRRSLFEQLERPALKPLPARPFEYEDWEQGQVNLDYHVRVRADEHRYSVPYHLVGVKLDVRLTAATVECFHQGERVASHLRSNKKNGFTTLPEHMPKGHREHAAWTPERIIRWAAKAGPAAAQVAERIIASRPHPEQGFGACRGLMRLGKEYGQDRLEAACVRALALNAPSFKNVNEILKQGLDQRPLPNATPSTSVAAHENVRGAEYYENTN